MPFEYYFIALSMLAGFVTLPRRKGPLYLRIFPFFLLVTLVTEIWAWELALKGITNTAHYNFISVTGCVFYLYILRHEIFLKRAKKIILIIMISYVILSLYNIFFGQKIDSFHTMTYSLGCFLIVAVSIYYFYELFQVPRSIDLKREPAFWIVSGLLFFYVCTLPLLGVVNYLYTFPDIINAALEQLITVLNVLLYSLFTIAFLCRINFKRFMLSSR